MTASMTLPPVVDIETTAALVARHAPIKIIDVRTSAQFESADIPASDNVPLDLLPEHRDELRDTLRVLREAQISQVHVLDGDLVAWESAGKPLQRGQQRWGLERQVRGLAGTLALIGALGSALIWRPLTYLAAIGAGLAYAAVTDACGMALALTKLPYNRAASCDVREVVARLACDAG